MDQVLDFITNNYLAFIIGGAVLLLAIIGFIGEKVRKGKKPAEGSVPVTTLPETNSKEATSELFGETAAAEPIAPVADMEQPIVEQPSAATTFEFSGYEPQSLGEQTAPILQPNQQTLASAAAVTEPVVDSLQTFAPFEAPVTELPVTTEPVVETITETPVVEPMAPVMEMPTVEPTVAEMPVAEPMAIPEVPVAPANADDTENRF